MEFGTVEDYLTFREKLKFNYFGDESAWDTIA